MADCSAPSHRILRSLAQSVVVIVSTEESAHIDVLLLLLLLLDGGGLSDGGTSSGSGSGGGGGDNGGQELTNVCGLQSLGEKGGPVWLDGVSGCLDNLVEFLSLYSVTMIGLLTVISMPSSWSMSAA